MKVFLSLALFIVAICWVDLILGSIFKKHIHKRFDVKF